VLTILGLGKRLAAHLLGQVEQQVPAGRPVLKAV
jgi:hypothetical protein